MINEIPCIRNKCLLLPICKTKEIIYCDILYNLAEEVYNNVYKRKININNLDVVNEFYLIKVKIKEIFPNAILLYINNLRYRKVPFSLNILFNRD